MGTLKFKGRNFFDCTTEIGVSTIGNPNPAFPNKIKGVVLNRVLTGWSLMNDNGWSTDSNYDASKGKIKVSGTAYSVSYDGTRPRNINAKYTRTGTGFTVYLNNVNGTLYASDSPNSATGTLIVQSKAPNKDCIVNLACWGAGGKGGGGAYWFLAGNWGGVGGGGGGKVFVTCCILNNDYFKIVVDSDSSKNGRTANSNDTTYQAPGFHMYKSSGTEQIACFGGYSGVSNHPRWSQDSYGGGGIISVQSYQLLPTIRRKYSTGGGKKNNGVAGNSCTFTNTYAPVMGNPEGHQGSLVLTGSGGSGPQTSYTQSQGSGGGGSYGNGGNAGDTGSGSNGSAGSNGGGGGGSGSPAGGANGGDGGYAGFIVFY